MNETTFETKVIAINYAEIDKVMDAYKILADSLNVLIAEYTKVFGQSKTLTLPIISEILNNEVKPFRVRMAKFLIEKLEQSITPITLRYDYLGITTRKDLPISPDLLTYLKTHFVTLKTDNKEINISGVELDLAKLIDLVVHPNYINLMAAAREAAYNRYDVFGGSFHNTWKKPVFLLIKKDLSNLFDGTLFDAELLRNEVTEHFTVRTKTLNQNIISEKVAEICKNLNELTDLGVPLEQSLWRREDYKMLETIGVGSIIDLYEGKYIVSSNIVYRVEQIQSQIE